MAFSPPTTLAQAQYQHILPSNPHLNATMEVAETHQRNDRMAEALADAELRALAAEQRLADIQSNVAQLRILLDRFQERAARAGFLDTDRNTIRNLTATDTPEEPSPASANARPRSTIRTTHERMTGRGRWRTRGENIPASTSGVSAIATGENMPRIRAVHQPIAMTTAGDGTGAVVVNGGTSAVEATWSQSSQPQSSIDNAMIEARDRQWEELRRRMASRSNGSG